MDFRQRNTIIKDDSTQDEWAHFENHIEMTSMDDLANISERLGLAPMSDWQDYRDTFGCQEWRHFVEAYEHVLVGNEDGPLHKLSVLREPTKNLLFIRDSHAFLA